MSGNVSQPSGDIGGIPPMFKPIIQQVVGALLAGLVVWLVGQGLLAPTERKLTEQNIELKAQTKTLRQQLRASEAANSYWSIPVPVTVAGE